jgi:hypothetical protein
MLVFLWVVIIILVIIGAFMIHPLLGVILSLIGIALWIMHRREN